MIEARPTLVIMAKAPRVGEGKQRLARDIGAVEAWRLNRVLNTATLRAARDPRWRTLLCVAERSALALKLPGVWPNDVRRTLQARGDLGSRLAHALAAHRNVAVIGTDSPDLTRARIAAAFRALRRAPFALGPSQDGGFWILAARSGRAAARAMAGVRWSSAHAARDVAGRLGGRVAMLETLADIDSGADLARWRQRSAATVRESSG
jgi:uncharacterized protein